RRCRDRPPTRGAAPPRLRLRPGVLVLRADRGRRVRAVHQAVSLLSRLSLAMRSTARPQRREARRSRAPTSPAARITTPIVLHGKPSPRVGRREPPPPAVATLGSVDGGVDGGGVVVVVVGGGVTV